MLFESQHQSDFVKWMEFHHPHITLYHIPNGERRTPQVGAKLKRMGVKKGVFDIYVMDWHLYIEFKKSHKEKLSEAQKKFKIDAERTGHLTMVAYNFKDAVDKISPFISAG